MNLLLLKQKEERTLLPAGTTEYSHLTEVLRVKAGQEIEVGIWQDVRGRSVVESVDAQHIILRNHWFNHSGDTGYPITLVVGCCRPVQAKRILREVTSLGVSRIVWVLAENTTPSYAQSSLWQQQEWFPEIQAGALQAFTNIGPDVIPPQPLVQYLETQSVFHGMRLALDNYETDTPLFAQAKRIPQDTPIELWVGPERGWSDKERQLFQQHHVSRVHLGCRVLKTEVACITGISQLLPCFSGYVQSHKESELRITGRSPRTPAKEHSKEA